MEMQGIRHAAVVCYCKYLITQQIQGNRQSRRVSNLKKYNDNNSLNIKDILPPFKI
jgi:hypothetical protein